MRYLKQNGPLAHPVERTLTLASAVKPSPTRTVALPAVLPGTGKETVNCPMVPESSLADAISATLSLPAAISSILIPSTGTSRPAPSCHRSP